MRELEAKPAENLTDDENAACHRNTVERNRFGPDPQTKTIFAQWRARRIFFRRQHYSQNSKATSFRQIVFSRTGWHAANFPKSRISCAARTFETSHPRVYTPVDTTKSAFQGMDIFRLSRYAGRFRPTTDEESLRENSSNASFSPGAFAGENRLLRPRRPDTRKRIRIKITRARRNLQNTNAPEA